MSRKMKVDFTGVESFQRASEGQHPVKIVNAELKQSQGGNDMIVVSFEVTKGADKDARVMENYPLAEQALWKLKGMLQAIGLKADGKVQLDLDKLIGKTLIIEVIHEEYNGSIRAHVDGYKKITAASDDEDDEDVDDEDLDDDDEDEEEEKPKKKTSKKAPAKKPAPKKKAPMNEPEDDDDEDDEDEDFDDDEDEEEEKPAPKKKAAKKPEKPAPKKPAKKSKKPEPEEEDDDEDDDEDWDEE